MKYNLIVEDLREAVVVGTYETVETMVAVIIDGDIVHPFKVSDDNDNQLIETPNGWKVSLPLVTEYGVGIYDSTEEGIANTVDGERFWALEESDGIQLLKLYANDSDNAVYAGFTQMNMSDFLINQGEVWV